MDDLLTEFVAETREMLEASEGEIIAWETDPSDRARLDAIFRFVHTVKGNCGFFDFPHLEKLSHAAEDVLAEVRAGRRKPDAALVTAVLAVIDRISEMVDAIEKGEEIAEESRDVSLIAALEADAGSDDSFDEVAASPSEEAGPARKTENGSSTPRTIRLPVDLLDRVMSGVSDMVLARNDLGHRLREAGNQPTIDGPFERLNAILNDVRDAVTRMRMQRIEHLFGAFPRLVRDLSNELGKQVMIDLEGGDVELDREMIEMIRDPLTHIIRNAIDHGIESPSERLKAGKREIGILGISARQAGNKISIFVTDDGGGLNVQKIGDKAVANGLITASQRDKMSREEIVQFVFEPGLSTADKVSAVSGRGVGLDVVRDNLEKIGGSIKVASTEGEGTRFFLQIPLTLSIISGLTVEVEGQRFAIPQSYVEEIVHLGTDGIEFANVGGTKLVDFRNQRTPCLSLADAIGLEHALAPNQRTCVMLKLASGDLFALEVDRILAITDLVVKPLPPAIMASELYAGSTLLDDGKPILLLDVPQIALNSGLVGETRSSFSRVIEDVVEVHAEKGVRAMLFTDLEGRRRAVRLELVQRIETVTQDAVTTEKGTARVVVDDEILPLAGLEGEPETGSKLRMLRLSDGSSDVLLAVTKVEDAITLDQELVEVDDDETLEAMTLVDGQSIGLIDGHRLFARYGKVPRRVAALTCRLPQDEWAQRILAPLLDSAGYKVADAQDTTVDIAIVLDDEGSASNEDDTTSPVIRLRSQPDDEVAEQEREASIYRYDRAGLLAALRQIKKGVAA